MLSAYYGRDTESRGLFERTKLSGHEVWDQFLQKYDLIRVTMTDFIKKDRMVDESLTLLAERILEELDERYPGTRYDPMDFVFSLNRFYQNDMTTFNGRDDVLSLLVHLGYLGFDDQTSQVFIPNREILDEFRTSTKGR